MGAVSGRVPRTRYTSKARTKRERTTALKRGQLCMVEYLVVGLGLVALLLRGVVLIGSQRIKRRAARIIAWHEQQHTGACGGMVMSVEVHP